MASVPWQNLMQFGLATLRLSPDQFWALTPKELVAMSGSDALGAAILTRSGLDDLMARFPDHHPKGQKYGEL